MEVCARFRSYLLLICIFLATGCDGPSGDGGVGGFASGGYSFPPSFEAVSTPVSVAENQAAVTTVSAYDREGDTLTYSLTGTDASALSISSSGMVTFNTAPDYETKTIYSVF